MGSIDRAPGPRTRGLPGIGAFYCAGTRRRYIAELPAPRNEGRCGPRTEMHVAPRRRDCTGASVEALPQHFDLQYNSLSDLALANATHLIQERCDELMCLAGTFLVRHMAGIQFVHCRSWNL